MRGGIRNKTVVALSLGLVGSMAAAKLLRPVPEDAQPYHLQVRKVVEAIPQRVGDWVGLDQEIPRSAVKLLRPNVLFHRQYRNLRTGGVATFLIVHCKDARDLAGHYPPNCYPANGWTQESQRPRDWNINDLPVTGTEYEFSRTSLTGETRIVVMNFMVLPNGQILRGMERVRHAASDYTRRFYGAAQFQLLMDASIAPDERDQYVAQLVGPNQSVIDTIRRE